MRTRAYRFSGEHPAFPAQWFTAYNVLFPANGFLATVAPEKPASRELDTSTAVPEPHAFAVRETAAFVFRRTRVHRIPPRVRDDREPPLSSGETGRACNGDLPDVLSDLFLIPWLDFNFGKSAVICPSG